MPDTLAPAVDYTSVEEGVQAIQSALAQQDVARARSIWEDLQRRFPDSAEAYQRPAFALVQQNRLDEADALISEGLQKFPADVALQSEAAWMAVRRGKVDEALSQWSALLARFPDRPNSYGGYGIALRNAGRLEEAEALLAGAMGRFPHDLGVAIEHAGIAHTMRNWPEAIRRWAQVRERFPQFSAGYTRGATTLREAGETAALEPLLLAAIERFPDESWPYVEHAMLAEHARDWPEALRRWDSCGNAFPPIPAAMSTPQPPCVRCGRKRRPRPCWARRSSGFRTRSARPSTTHGWRSAGATMPRRIVAGRRDAGASAQPPDGLHWWGRRPARHAGFGRRAGAVP